MCLEDLTGSENNVKECKVNLMKNESNGDNRNEPLSNSSSRRSSKSSIISLLSETSSSSIDEDQVYRKRQTVLDKSVSDKHDHQRPDQYHHHEKVSSHQIHALIRECELFSLAPNSCVDEIADNLQILVIPPKEFIVNEGEESKALYWILKGSVHVTSRDGQMVYAELNQGYYFGEIGVMMNTKRRCSAISHTKCVLLSLNSDALKDIVSRYPLLDQHIRQLVHQHLQQLLQALKLHESKDELLLHNIIEKLSFFKQVDKFGVDMIASVSKIQLSNANDIIIEKNYQLDALHFIISGSVTANKNNRILTRGDIIGSSAFLTSRTTEYSYIASTKVRVLAVPFTTMKILCDKYPYLFDKLQQQQVTKTIKFSTDKKPQEVYRKLPINGLYSEAWNANALPSPPTVAPFTPSPIAEEIVDIPAPEKPSKIINKQQIHSLQQQQPQPQSQPQSQPQLQLQPSLTTFKSSPAPIRLHPHQKKQRTVIRRRASLFNVGPFPDIIQIKIFQHLPLPSQMKMQLVCNHWRDMLTQSSLLLKTLDLTPYNNSITDKSIVPIVDFVGTRPRVVDISNCFHLTDEGFLYIINGIGLANIQVFKMRSVWAVNSMAILELTAPSIGSELQEADLSNCRNVNDETVTRLIGWKVPEFNQDGSRVTYPLPGTAVGCSSLKRLTLSYCKHLSDRLMYHMAEYAADRLVELDLTRCTGVTDQGFAYWSMKPFTSLRRLNLSDCTFLTDRAMISLAGTAKELEDLNLSFCCALTDVSVQVLSLGCRKLKNLDMAYCGSAVSDASLSMIALHLHELESLSVRGCVRVTRSGVDTVLMGCVKLTKLNITQCRNI